MEKTFQIGDKVKIVTLESKLGHMNGMLGHVGEVTKIEAGVHEPFYILKPYCTGRGWPADCLELVRETTKKPINTLFSFDEL